MMPRTLRTCPTEHTAGAKEKHELLFFVFVHGGSPSRRSCFCLVVHVCVTAQLPMVLVVGASCGPALCELGGQHRKRSVFGTAPSPLAGTLAPQDTNTQLVW